MKLKPLGDRLIVKAVEEEATTASGIVLPDTAKEKPQRGNVIAGRQNEAPSAALAADDASPSVRAVFGRPSRPARPIS